MLDPLEHSGRNQVPLPDIADASESREDMPVQHRGTRPKDVVLFPVRAVLLPQFQDLGRDAFYSGVRFLEFLLAELRLAGGDTARLSVELVMQAPWKCILDLVEGSLTPSL